MKLPRKPKKMKRPKRPTQLEREEAMRYIEENSIFTIHSSQKQSPQATLIGRGSPSSVLSWNKTGNIYSPLNLKREPKLVNDRILSEDPFIRARAMVAVNRIMAKANIPSWERYE